MKYGKLILALFISFALGITLSRLFENKSTGGIKEAGERHEEESELELSKESQELAALKTAKVQLSTFKNKIPVVGQIAQDAQSSVHVVSPVIGEITEMKAQIGAAVRKDEIICTVSKTNGEVSVQEVRSPIAGIVIGVFAKPKDKVDTVSSIYTIADLTKLWVTFEVYEKDIADIKLGQKVIARSVAYSDKIFNGEIVFISPRVDESSHTIKIRAIVNNEDYSLKLGMFMSAEIISESEESYLSVPARAVQIMGSDSVVFVKAGDGKFALKKIKVKAETKDAVLIDASSSQGEHSQVKEGDEVIVEGAFLLKSELLKGELEEE